MTAAAAAMRAFQCLSSASSGPVSVSDKQAVRGSRTNSTGMLCPPESTSGHSQQVPPATKPGCKKMYVNVKPELFFF